MTISTFRPMLAANTIVDKLKYPLIVQPKYDGIRCIIHPILGPITRTLKPIPNKYIQETLSNIPSIRYMDGELITYTNNKIDNLNIINGNVMSRDGFPDFILYLFDCFKNPKDKYIKRYNKILYLKEKFIKIVPYKIINSEDELYNYENSIVNNNYEGIIIRNPEASYKYGRSSVKEGSLLKMKRFFDDEGIIIGFTELLYNNNLSEKDNFGLTKRSTKKANKTSSNKLGSLLIKKVKDNIVFEVGTGFTNKQRVELWNNRSDILGKYITFKYQRNSHNNIPLLPVFKSFRDISDFKE